MENNSFSFMKEGFDWQSAQSKDMAEIADEGVRAFINDRHDSDEEELKRESKDMIEIRNDAIYEEERERRAGVTEWTEDRHNSDEEELKRESKELRDYNDFFDMEDR